MAQQTRLSVGANLLAKIQRGVSDTAMNSVPQALMVIYLIPEPPLQQPRP